MPVLSLACHLPHNTPNIPSRYNNEQTTKQTKAINNSYIYIYIYISHVNVTQTVPDISPLMPMHQDPLLVVFTEHKSSADHNGGQPGCKWTSQIWNAAHCLGALGRGHFAYAYDISQICRNMMCFHSWIDKIVDFPRCLDATARWKKIL